MTLLGERLHLWRIDTAIKMAPIFHNSLYLSPYPWMALWLALAKRKQWSDVPGASPGIKEVVPFGSRAGLLEDETTWSIMEAPDMFNWLAANHRYMTEFSYTQNCLANLQTHEQK